MAWAPNKRQTIIWTNADPIHWRIYASLLRSSDAYMRQWIGSALVRVMGCHLSGAKPLPEPILPYCKLDHWEQTSVKFELKLNKIVIRENAFESVVCEMEAILSRGDELTYIVHILIGI